MKRIILVLLFVASSITGNAQNSLGNVSMVAYIMPQDTSLRVRLEWWDNDSLSTISPTILWDTVPDRGKYRIDLGQFTSRDSALIIPVTKYIGCKDYFVSVEFFDGETGKKYQTSEQFLETPGMRAPEIKEVKVIDLHPTYAVMEVTVDQHCSWFQYNLTYNTGTEIRGDNQWPQQGRVITTLYGLSPNTEISTTIAVSNSYGWDGNVFTFRTKGNTPPEPEALKIVPQERSALATAYVDLLNAGGAKYRIEYGQSVLLSTATPWRTADSTAAFVVGLTDLKPNTEYFWRVVARNDFGQDESQIKAFRTDQSASLYEGNLDSGILIANGRIRAKGASIEAYDLSGRLLLAGENEAVLLPGVYLIRIIRAKEVLTKKIAVR